MLQGQVLVFVLPISLACGQRAKLLDCQDTCTATKMDETFDECIWEYKNVDSHECLEECEEIHE